MTAAAQAQALAALLALEQHAREAASAAELAFVMVNDSRTLAEFRQAALFTPERGLVAVSGVAAPEPGAPFTLWMERLFAALPPTPPVLTGGAERLPAADAAEWGEWLPAHALWLALSAPDGTRLGTLMFARETPWSDGEVALLSHAAGMFGQSWAWRHRPTPWHRWRQSVINTPRRRLKLAAAIVLLLLFPVRQSVLAPAEVVAHAPAVIRSPLEGVVEKILVTPNQTVPVGAPLFSLDRTALAGKIEVARSAVQTGRAELDQATQQAFFDPKAKGQVAVIKSRLDERTAELTQLEDLQARSDVRSPRAGVVVMDAPSEWTGRPVGIGEKVMAIADPAEVEVEAWLAPADLIALDPDAPVVLFLNASPLSPVRASLLYVTYEATLRPDGLLGHRVRAATAKDEDAPRLGAKGTARLDGTPVPLIYWLLRRPLATIRSTLGI